MPVPYLTPPRILIVDDNPFNRELLSEALLGEGLLVEEAQNGIEAISKIKTTDFNLILLDLLMPGMDGYETTKRIRQMGITVPIVAVSAIALKQDRWRSLHAGCNDFLSKPIDGKELQSILQKYVNHLPGEAGKAGTTSSLAGKDDLQPAVSLFKGHHLLLVEESEHLRKYYGALFLEAGFQVQGLANGVEALKFIKNPENTVHMIVSNIFTSIIDGIALLKIVKRNSAKILVFLYTQTFDPSTFQYAVHQKVDGIIPQDQFENTALGIIETAMEQSRLKGSRASDAGTAALVRQAQAQLIHPGCIHLCPCLDLAYHPLHEAGGDLMRCHRFGLDGRCGIVLADVAGHDVMSSYTSATFIGVLSSFWDSHQDPAALLKKLNKELIKIGNHNSHVCATAMVWDRGSGRLAFGSAGNPGGLMVSFDSNGRAAYQHLAGGGMVLGSLEIDDLFVSGAGKLDRNDYLFLFSDGIEEQALITAVEKRADLFAAGRLKGICQSLLDTLLEKKEQEDDLILVCIHNPEKWVRPDFHAEFFSTYEEVDRACIWIDQNLPIETIPKGNDKDLILLSAREALLNAVEHGNETQPTAHFEVALYIKDTELRIAVSDEGTGYDLNANVREPKDLTLTQIGKRGLSLMASVGQEVMVEGRTVTLVFKDS